MPVTRAVHGRVSRRCILSGSTLLKLRTEQDYCAKQKQLEETRIPKVGSSSLFTDSRLQLPLQIFMLPYLTPALRVSLRASCTTLQSLVDTDVAFWGKSGLVEPALVNLVVNAPQVQSILKRQGRALACMRSGKSEACFKFPRAANDSPIKGCWSKCAAIGSLYASFSCAGETACCSVLDMHTGKLQDAIFPNQTSHGQASMWLYESRLLAHHGGCCQVMALTDGQVRLIWSGGVGQMISASPTLASPPAFVWQPTHDDLKLISTRSFSPSDLPKATCSSFKPEVRMLSWSPDHSHLAVVFKFCKSPTQLWNTEHTVCIYRTEDAESPSHVELQGLSKCLWSPDSATLACWNKDDEELMIQDMHGSAHLSRHLRGVEDIASWANSPDSKLLAVCCRSVYCDEDSKAFHHDEEIDICVYSIIRVTDNRYGAVSKSLPYDLKVLPGASWSNEAFFVSPPVWAASSKICFLPYVKQIFSTGKGIADVPVSHWAQMSPCGNLLVTAPCPLKSQAPHSFWHLTHHHIPRNQSCPVLEEHSDTDQDIAGKTIWLKVAWLPFPYGAQMYAVHVGNANMIHLINGQSNSVCCSWHIPTMSQKCPRNLTSQASEPFKVWMQWSPDARSLFVAPRGMQPAVITFDTATAAILKRVSCSNQTELFEA